jgi:hypothetical protein
MAEIVQGPIGNTVKTEGADGRQNSAVCHHAELMGSSKGQGAAFTCVDVDWVDNNPAISIVRMSLKFTPGVTVSKHK